MGWNPCPATNRLFHVFDKATHRCACGRWERGHAPKKEHKRPRAECQICEREQALDTAGKKMGHHGYTRPGCGYQVGDCFGVGHAPYNATDALVKYAERVESYLGFEREALAALPAALDLPFTYSHYLGNGQRSPAVTVRVKKGEPSTYLKENGKQSVHVPGFLSLYEQAEFRIKQDIAHAQLDLERVRARIKKAAQ